MTLRCVKIECVSPHGVRVVVDASPGGSLGIDRKSPVAAFVDIRDEGLPKHADDFERLVAQVPAEWLLVPRWAE